MREVTLLGQNVNSYGRDLPKDGRVTFAELLREVDAIDGIDRIRYTSPHPTDMREDVIRAHAELPALCEHIHLPLQSGSTRILKAMKRPYNSERYLDRVALIREHVPDVALTTDIIVGFPGETEAGLRGDARGGRAGALRLGVHVHLLAAPRHGGRGPSGPAAASVKRERMERLVELVQRNAAERAQRFVGRTMEVLVEGPSRTDPSKLRGRTRHNKTVNFSGCRRAGEIAQVEIASATSTTLAGEESLLARRRRLSAPPVIALFGPTGVGKTAVAVALADGSAGGRGRDLRRRAAGLRGLPILTGAASEDERAQLEHRLVGFVPINHTFSVGEFMPLAHGRSTTHSPRAARRSLWAVPASTCARRCPSSTSSRRRPRTCASGSRRRPTGSAPRRCTHAWRSARPRRRRRSSRRIAAASSASSSCSRWAPSRTRSRR